MSSPRGPAPPSKGRGLGRRLLDAGRLLLGVGLIVYLAVSGVIEWSALAELLSDWRLTGTALLLLAVAAVLTAGRLCLLLRPRGYRITWWASTRLTLIGAFFNLCLPGAGGGDLVRIYYATVGNEGYRSEVATIMVLDRVTGFFAMVALPVLLAPLFPALVAGRAVVGSLVAAAALAVAGLLAFFLVVIRAGRLQGRFGFLSRLPGERYLRSIASAVLAFRDCPGALVRAVALSLFIQSMTVGAVLLLVVASPASEFGWSAALLTPLGFVANALPLTPGGLGVGEAAFDGLFSLGGLEGGAEAILGWRLLMLLIGLAGAFFYLRGDRRFVFRAPSPDRVGS